MMTAKKKRSILVVDDDRMLRTLLKAILREEGFDVVGEAGTGEEALGLCGKLSPDVLCLDVMLPGLSGIEVLKQVRERHPGVRVVMVTGDASTATVRDAVGFGASGYILKPFNARRVSDTLRQVLKPSEGGIG